MEEGNQNGRVHMITGWEWSVDPTTVCYQQARRERGNGGFSRARDVWGPPLLKNTENGVPDRPRNRRRSPSSLRSRTDTSR